MAFRGRGGFTGNSGRGGSNGNGNTNTNNNSNNGSGEGSQARRPVLPEITGRFDRYCVWCGEVIVDCALERLGRCNSRRCFRALPLALQGRRRPDGYHRCARCYCLSHRSFLFCEICGRPRTGADVYGQQVNMDGVDLSIVDLMEITVSTKGTHVLAPHVPSPPNPVVVNPGMQIPQPPVSQQPSTPLLNPEDWAEDSDIGGLLDNNTDPQ